MTSSLVRHPVGGSETGTDPRSTHLAPGAVRSTTVTRGPSQQTSSGRRASVPSPRRPAHTPGPTTIEGATRGLRPACVSPTFADDRWDCPGAGPGRRGAWCGPPEPRGGDGVAPEGAGLCRATRRRRRSVRGAGAGCGAGPVRGCGRGRGRRDRCRPSSAGRPSRPAGRSGRDRGAARERCADRRHPDGGVPQRPRRSPPAGLTVPEPGDSGAGGRGPRRGAAASASPGSRRRLRGSRSTAATRPRAGPKRVQVGGSSRSGLRAPSPRPGSEGRGHLLHSSPARLAAEAGRAGRGPTEGVSDPAVMCGRPPPRCPRGVPESRTWRGRARARAASPSGKGSGVLRRVTGPQGASLSLRSGDSGRGFLKWG